MRTKSDASAMIQRRPRNRAPGEVQRIRRHRFSINGHFYNHKVKSRLPLRPSSPWALREAELGGTRAKHGGQQVLARSH